MDADLPETMMTDLDAGLATGAGTAGAVPGADAGAEPLAEARWERFALRVAGGECSAAEAYRQEVSAACSKASAATAGPRLALRPVVAARVAWLRAQVQERARAAAQDATEVAVLTLLEKRRFLARVVRTPIGAVDEMSDLCQEMTERTSASSGSVRVKMPGKLEAIRLDNDLAGLGCEDSGQEALMALARRLRG